MKTTSKFCDIFSDYTDDNNVLHFDAFLTSDPDEQGKTVAWLFNGKPYYANAEDQFDPKLREAIQEELNDTLQSHD